MPFPQASRVIYQKNPLDRVICQLRFPPILKIDTEIPAEFQDRVRGQFPNFSESLEFIKISSAIEGAGAPEVLKQVTETPRNKNYEFTSEDGHWKINLTRNFIALTAHQYTRWEEFKEKLSIPLNSLTDIYSPSYFSRIGLRYVNVINRSALHLEDVRWNELLQPYILAFLGSPEISDYIKNLECKYEVGLLDDESVVRIITKFVQAVENDETCYMIDSDFFSGSKTAIDATVNKLDYFNVRSSRLLQWSITERLHQAMEPQRL